MHRANSDGQGLFLLQMQSSKRPVRNAISDAVERPVEIVLLDSEADRLPRFPQVAIFRSPDFLFFQTAMEAFNVAVASRMRIRRTPMRNAQSVAQVLANPQSVRHAPTQMRLQTQNETNSHVNCPGGTLHLCDATHGRYRHLGSVRNHRLRHPPGRVYTILGAPSIHAAAC